MGRTVMCRLLSRLRAVPHPRSQGRAAQVRTLRRRARAVAQERANGGATACLVRGWGPAGERRNND